MGNAKAGLLACFRRAAFPFLQLRLIREETFGETVAAEARQTREAYSCGDSSGIQPDSLFSLAPQSESGHLYGCKDRQEFLVYKLFVSKY